MPQADTDLYVRDAPRLNGRLPVGKQPVYSERSCLVADRAGPYAQTEYGSAEHSCRFELCGGLPGSSWPVPAARKMAWGGSSGSHHHHRGGGGRHYDPQEHLMYARSHQRQISSPTISCRTTGHDAYRGESPRSESSVSSSLLRHRHHARDSRRRKESRSHRLDLEEEDFRRWDSQGAHPMEWTSRPHPYCTYPGPPASSNHWGRLSEEAMPAAGLTRFSPARVRQLFLDRDGSGGGWGDYGSPYSTWGAGDGSHTMHGVGKNDTFTHDAFLSTGRQSHGPNLRGLSRTGPNRVARVC